IRNNVRTYIRKQIELPRQELAEILKANLNAAKWFGIAFAFGMLTLISLAVLVIAVIAIWLPLWASALIALVLFAVITAFLGWSGYKRLELRGPTRSSQSFKESLRKEIADVQEERRGPKEALWGAGMAAITAAATTFAQRFAGRFVEDDAEDRRPRT